MAIRVNGLRFMADFMITGERYRRQFPTQVEAAAWEAEIRRRVTFKLPVSDVLDPKEALITLQHVLGKCFTRHWEGTKNEHQCLLNIALLERHFGATTPITSIDLRVIDDFIGELQRKGNKPATINQKLATLSKALTFAEEREYIQKKPKIQRMKVGNNSRRRFFSHEDEKKILKACQKHGMSIFQCWVCWSIDTGMRPEETRRARREDIREDSVLGWVIDINEVKNTAGTTEPRTIPLTARALGAWEVAEAGGYDHREVVQPFAEFNGKTRQKCWNKIRKELGETDPDFVPYTCRHTCATRLVQGNVNLKAVMQWLGHKDISMTMKYCKLVPTDLLAGVSALSRLA